MTDDVRRQIAEAAVAGERATGFPAEVAFAQCALESKDLENVYRNNPFGIKWHRLRHKGKERQLLRTTEWLFPDKLAEFLVDGRQIIEDTGKVDAKGRHLYKVRDWFATYPTLHDAFVDYGTMLQRGLYAAAWAKYKQDGDLIGLIEGIDKGGYATAGGYASAVKGRLDDAARAAIEEARHGATS